MASMKRSFQSAFDEAAELDTDMPAATWGQPQAQVQVQVEQQVQQRAHDAVSATLTALPLCWGPPPLEPPESADDGNVAHMPSAAVVSAPTPTQASALRLMPRVLTHPHSTQRSAMLNPQHASRLSDTFW